MKPLYIMLFLVINLLSFSANAQFNESKKSLSNRIELKLNYSNVNSNQIIPDYTNSTTLLKEFIYKKNPQYNFEGLYLLNEIWSFGVYLGYSRGTYIRYNAEYNNDDDSYFVSMNSFGNSLSYGVESNIQLLPLLLKSENLRFNLYCPVRIGMVSQNLTTSFVTNTKIWEKPVLEFGAGLGLSYYFTKNIGIFGEYQLGQFYNNRYTQWKMGLALKF